MSKTVCQDTELLEEIAIKYDEAADKIEDAIKKTEQTRTEMLADYAGQGKDLSDDAFKKLKEHLELLKECLVQISSYISYSKDTLDSTDKGLGKTK